jgi:hypothetical protein
MERIDHAPAEGRLEVGVVDANEVLEIHNLAVRAMGLAALTTMP